MNTDNIDEIIRILEEAKRLSDKVLGQMKPHTREYLYFDDVRNGLGLEINRYKKYIKLMEEE